MPHAPMTKEQLVDGAGTHGEHFRSGCAPWGNRTCTETHHG
jgi:hypothetical protein